MINGYGFILFIYVWLSWYDDACLFVNTSLLNKVFLVIVHFY